MTPAVLALLQTLEKEGGSVPVVRLVENQHIIFVGLGAGMERAQRLAGLASVGYITYTNSTVHLEEVGRQQLFLSTAKPIEKAIFDLVSASRLAFQQIIDSLKNAVEGFAKMSRDRREQQVRNALTRLMSANLIAEEGGTYSPAT